MQYNCGRHFWYDSVKYNRKIANCEDGYIILKSRRKKKYIGCQTFEMYQLIFSVNNLFCYLPYPIQNNLFQI